MRTFYVDSWILEAPRIHSERWGEGRWRAADRRKLCWPRVKISHLGFLPHILSRELGSHLGRRGHLTNISNPKGPHRGVADKCQVQRGRLSF